MKKTSPVILRIASILKKLDEVCESSFQDRSSLVQYMRWMESGIRWTDAPPGTPGALGGIRANQQTHTLSTRMKGKRACRRVSGAINIRACVEKIELKCNPSISIP